MPAVRDDGRALVYETGESVTVTGITGAVGVKAMKRCESGILHKTLETTGWANPGGGG